MPCPTSRQLELLKSAAAPASRSEPSEISLCLDQGPVQKVIAEAALARQHFDGMTIAGPDGQKRVVYSSVTLRRAAGGASGRLVFAICPA